MSQHPSETQCSEHGIRICFPTGGLFQWYCVSTAIIRGAWQDVHSNLAAILGGNKAFVLKNFYLTKR